MDVVIAVETSSRQAHAGPLYLVRLAEATTLAMAL